MLSFTNSNYHYVDKETLFVKLFVVFLSISNHKIPDIISLAIHFVVLLLHSLKTFQFFPMCHRKASVANWKNKLHRHWFSYQLQSFEICS